MEIERYIFKTSTNKHTIAIIAILTLIVSVGGVTGSVLENVPTAKAITCNSIHGTNEDITHVCMGSGGVGKGGGGSKSPPRDDGGDASNASII